MYAKVHNFWEKHELVADAIVLATALTLLVPLSIIALGKQDAPAVLHAVLPPTIDSIEDEERAVLETPVFTTTASSPSIQITDTREDDARARMAIELEITKTDQALSRITHESVALVAAIAHECGTQGNACAEEKQAALETHASTYEELNLKLQSLTAALGNLP